jgi:RNA polymerase sigma-70 factor (ECF subfamily)
MTGSRYVSLYVDETELVRELPLILKVLRANGVQERDLDDVAQDVLIGAWLAVQEGRFKVLPGTGADRRTGLQRWLTGIAWRQASHYRDRAYNRYEVPFSHPGEYVSGEAPPSDAQVAAREALRIALPELPPECVEVLALSATGATTAEIAEELRIPEGTAASRRRRARERFALSLRRWRR